MTQDPYMPPADLFKYLFGEEFQPLGKIPEVKVTRMVNRDELSEALRNEFKL